MRFLILTLLFSICSLYISYAEGTHEVAPNAAIVVNGNNTTDIAALHINHPDYNSFASYTNPDPHSRLYIHIINPSTECVFVGFSFGHPNVTSPTPPHISYEYRIKDPNGNIVFGPVNINPGDENILDWSSAYTGPMQLQGPGGYNAINVSSTDLTSQGWSGTGDYYIEFQNDAGSDFLIDFWDVTVADCSVVPALPKTGRIWSYNWSFFAINDFGFPNRPFDGAFYVCAPDPDEPDAAFITKIDFNGAGFRPAAFNVAFNSFGIQNTGNVDVDRRSVENVNATQSEYSIFLNDPIEFCKTATVGEINLLGVSRCNAEEYCIKFTTTKEGQIELLLDFDGPDSLYTPGTADVLITNTVGSDQVGIPTCIEWDGLDGLGNPVFESSGTLIPVIISYAQGIYHFPIFDAEYMTQGFMIQAVRPPASIPLLHYDDSNITVVSGSGEPQVQISGCMNPCHRWTNYNNVTNIGYGNLNTINSWWFSQRIIRQDVFILPAYYTCAIEGPSSFCQGGSATLTSIPQVVPIGATGGEIISTAWSGPGIVGPDTGNSITVDSDGTYSVVTKWVSSLGDTCEISCDLSLTLDPPLTGSIDTLILLGQTVEINGESYSDPGEYTQMLTSLNGCDSLLTIRVKVAQTTILYNLNACVSHNNGDGTDMDYSEFTPLYPQPLSCADVTGTILFRDPPAGNKHSCTNGVNNSVAMCVSSLDGCTYAPGDQKSVVFEITVVPSQDTAAQLTGLTFFEQGPTTFNWLSGNSGPNNYPTLFGIRVLKNGTEIFRREDIPTTTAWTEETFDFVNEIDFITNEPAVFRFELLPYCLVGNGAAVAAWDIDEIKVSASCVPFNFAPVIEGVIATEGGHSVKNVEMQMSDEPTFQSVREVVTNQFGQYKYDHNKYGSNYYVKGTKDTEPRNGVSTLDLVLIQKHLLGIKTFQSPYLMVAADANHSGSVSVLDLLELRKLILGIYTTLPHNTSWRFGNASQNPGTLYPWGFKETIEIEALSKDIHDANFTAVKIGDVNGDAKVNISGTDITKRDDAKISLFVNDQQVVAGVPVRIDFASSVLSELAGLQLALQVSNLDVQQVLGGKMNLSDDNYHLTQDRILRISWNAIESINTDNGEVLFSIVVIPNKSGYLSEMLGLVPSALNAEAYAGSNLEKLNLDLDIRRPDYNSSTNTLFQNEPNPFSSNTKIRFQLEKSGQASIRLYDLSGHLLKEITDQFTSGMNEIEISNTELGMMDGVVICQLQCNGFIAVQRMVLMR